MSRFVQRALLFSFPMLAAVAALVVSAQENSSQIPSVTIRTSTRMVLVDVVVTKKGQPVTGLQADDFVVEENGKKQKVSVFVPPQASRTQPAPPPPGILSNHPESVGPAVTPTILLLDALNSPFKEQAYARSQMLKYVAEQGESGRPMAVLALGERLHVLQQFTSDPQVLLTAIKNFRPGQPILQPSPPAAASAVPANMEGPGSGIALAIANAQGELASFSNLQVGYELERRTTITIEAMRTLTRMLGGLPGRKNVVWLTADLPFDLIPEDRTITEEQLMADLPGQGRQRPVGVNAAGSIAAQQRELHNAEIRDAEARLASANISIYPVDLRGLLAGTEGQASQSSGHTSELHGASLANAALAQGGGLEASHATMEEVAAETGGRAFFNQNEIKVGVALAAADDQASYTLGYYPENKKWDGKYHTIKVKVARPDTQVRYRKGYFAVDPALTKEAHYDRDLLSAIEFSAPATQVSFMAQSTPVEPGKIRVVFLVDAHTLNAEDSGGNKRLNVNLYAFAYDANGRNLGSRSTKVDRAFDAATFQQILDKGMMVPIDMDVPKGATQLRLAVLDNKTGFIGTVSGPLE
ncbi:MAG TPA: VWA domain-containing protein [Terriglobales bacterium]|nr:VWA domain-containing protein [Terriglobales bacterium]